MVNYNRLNYRAYGSWDAMKQRCSNPNKDHYYMYGGKGITYDPKWEKFSNFLEDMGERPAGDYVLDRIDPKGDYSKENCRWITRSENTRRGSIKDGLSKTTEYKKRQREKQKTNNPEYFKIYYQQNRERLLEKAKTNYYNKTRGIYENESNTI